MLNNCDLNIAQNNHDYDFYHNRADLAYSQTGSRVQNAYLLESPIGGRDYFQAARDKMIENQL